MQDTWQARERTLPSGTVVRWVERQLANGEVERRYDVEGQQRVTAPQALNVRAS